MWATAEGEIAARAATRATARDVVHGVHRAVGDRAAHLPLQLRGHLAVP